MSATSATRCDRDAAFVGAPCHHPCDPHPPPPPPAAAAAVAAAAAAAAAPPRGAWAPCPRIARRSPSAAVVHWRSIAWWSTGKWRRLDWMPHRLGRAVCFLTSQRERCGWCYGCGGDSGSAGGCGSSTLLCKQLSERAHANAFGHGRPRRPARAPAWRRRQHSAQREIQALLLGGAIFHYTMYTANA